MHVERSINDMLVGDDDSRWVDDEARRIDLYAPWRLIGLGGGMHLPLGDIHHGRTCLLDDGSIAIFNHARGAADPSKARAASVAKFSRNILRIEALRRLSGK